MTEHVNDTSLLVEDCIHLLPLVSCRLCKDAATGRPTGTDFQRYMAPRRAQRAREAMVVKVSDTATVRPMDPTEWTKAEWKQASADIRKRLRSYDRDRYPGRTLGPKDLSIKPINRNRR